MKYALLPALALLLVPTLGHAEKLTLTVRTATELLLGLSALDGSERVVKEGTAERVLKEPYKLPAGVRLAIARNIVTLRAVVGPVQLAYQGKVVELTGGREPSPEIARQLRAEELSLETLTQDIELTKIGTRDLGLEPPASNPIPPSILAQLTPILTE